MTLTGLNESPLLLATLIAVTLLTAATAVAGFCLRRSVALCDTLYRTALALVLIAPAASGAFWLAECTWAPLSWWSRAGNADVAAAVRNSHIRKPPLDDARDDKARINSPQVNKSRINRAPIDDGAPLARSLSASAAGANSNASGANRAAAQQSTAQQSTAQQSTEQQSTEQQSTEQQSTEQQSTARPAARLRDAGKKRDTRQPPSPPAEAELTEAPAPVGQQIVEALKRKLLPDAASDPARDRIPGEELDESRAVADESAAAGASTVIAESPVIADTAAGSPALAGRRARLLWGVGWAVYSLGVVWMLCRHGIGWLALRRLRRRAFPAPIDELPPATSWCSQLSTPPPVWLSDRLLSPVVAGAAAPVILLPARMLQECQDGELAAALCHEAAHISRGDPWMVWAQAMATSIWWFHPLVHAVGRAARRTSEELCDNHVLAQRGAVDYADALLRLAGRLRGPIPQGLAMFHRGRRALEQRIERLLDDRRDCRTRAPGWLRWPLIASLAALAAGLSSATWRESARAMADEMADEMADDTAAVAPASPAEIGDAGGGRRDAAEPARQVPWKPSVAETSLGKAPRDAVFYYGLYGMGELLDEFRRSELHASLQTTAAFRQFQREFLAPWTLAETPPTAGRLPRPPRESLPTREQLERQALGRDLQSLWRRMFQQDVFVYGDRTWLEFARRRQKIAAQVRRLIAAKSLAPDPAVWRELASLPLPATVLGFAIDDVDVGRARRLMQALENKFHEASAETAIFDVRREPVGDDEFLTVNASGFLLPWHLLQQATLTPEQEEALDEAIQTLVGRRVTLAIGVRDNCLLVSLGEGVAHLQRFGAGESLLRHPELAPLEPAQQRRLTSVGLVADDWARTGFDPRAAGWLHAVGWLIQEIKVNDHKATGALRRIGVDLQELERDWNAGRAAPAGWLHYSCRTAAGLEGVRVARRGAAAPPARFDVQRHLGAEPLLVAAVDGAHDRRRAALLKKWCGRAGWYFNRAAYSAPDLETRLFLAALSQRFGAPLRQILELIDGELLPAFGAEGRAVVVSELADERIAVSLIQSVKDADRVRSVGRPLQAQLDQLMFAAKSQLPMLGISNIPITFGSPVGGRGRAVPLISESTSQKPPGPAYPFYTTRDASAYFSEAASPPGPYAGAPYPSPPTGTPAAPTRGDAAPSSAVATPAVPQFGGDATSPATAMPAAAPPLSAYPPPPSPMPAAPPRSAYPSPPSQLPAGPPRSAYPPPPSPMPAAPPRSAYPSPPSPAAPAAPAPSDRSIGDPYPASLAPRAEPAAPSGAEPAIARLFNDGGSGRAAGHSRRNCPDGACESCQLPGSAVAIEASGWPFPTRFPRGQLTPTADGLRYEYEPPPRLASRGWRPHFQLSPAWLVASSHVEASDALLRETAPAWMPPSVRPQAGEQLTSLRHIRWAELPRRARPWIVQNLELGNPDLENLELENSKARREALTLWDALLCVESYTRTESQGRQHVTRWQWTFGKFGK